MSSDNKPTDNQTTNTKSVTPTSVVNDVKKNADSKNCDANNKDANKKESEKVLKTIFPSATELRKQLYDKSFNAILELIMNKLNDSNTNPSIVSVRLMNHEVSSHLPNIMVDVRKFLVEKGYTITEIEDAAAITSGIKISWAA